MAVLGLLLLVCAIGVLLRLFVGAEQEEAAETAGAPTSSEAPSEGLESATSGPSTTPEADIGTSTSSGSSPPSSVETPSAIAAADVNNILSRFYSVEVFGCSGFIEAPLFDLGSSAVLTDPAAVQASVAGHVAQDGILVPRLGYSEEGQILILETVRPSTNVLEYRSARDGESVVLVGPSGRPYEGVVDSRFHDGQFVVRLINDPGEVGSVAAGTDGQLLGIVTELDAAGSALVAALPLQIGSRDRLQGGSCDDVVHDVAVLGIGTEWRSATHLQTQTAALAQALATAFARQDIAAVRRLDRARTAISTTELAEGWGALRASTLIPVFHTRVSGTSSRWRFGLLTHETVAADEVSKLFCVTWDVDLATETVLQTGIDSILLFELEGWAEPLEWAWLAKSEC